MSVVLTTPEAPLVKGIYAPMNRKEKQLSAALEKSRQLLRDMRTDRDNWRDEAKKYASEARQLRKGM